MGVLILFIKRVYMTMPVLSLRIPHFLLHVKLIFIFNILSLSNITIKINEVYILNVYVNDYLEFCFSPVFDQANQGLDFWWNARNKFYLEWSEGSRVIFSIKL